jgi:hypothetical protein
MSATDDAGSEDDLYALKAKITKQQSAVRQLKKDGAASEVSE